MFFTCTCQQLLFSRQPVKISFKSWTGIKDYTTWNLLYIDYSTYPAQLECSGHESSTLQHDQLSSSLQRDQLSSSLQRDQLSSSLQRAQLVPSS